jgi:hypothetical protein
MNYRLIGGSSRQARRIATAGAVLLALAAPFFTQPAASAYPGYQVSIACSATNGGSANASWGWYRGHHRDLPRERSPLLSRDIRKRYQQRNRQRDSAGHRRYAAVRRHGLYRKLWQHELQDHLFHAGIVRLG